MPLLEVQNVSMKFGGLTALADFNFTIDKGELVGLIGPNGAGKSTAFNAVTGIYRPTAGTVSLASQPKILCLDEPAAGMNPQEKIELTGLIRFIRDTFGVGIWLIEHDMKLVMALCERITVLDHGETIAIGPPSEIQSNPNVIEA